MITIIIRTVILYLFVTLAIRLMGKRQIGELEVNELVTTLLISEIGALPISDSDIPLLPSLIPILLIASIEIIISIIKNKSALIKRAVEGEPSYIIYKGRLRQKALAENRISINEVLTEMRTQGIADIADIRYAILEQNGKMSFLKTSDSPNISKTLVVDTKPNLQSIKEEGLSEEWLNKVLKERKITLSEVFLLTVNEDGTVNIIKKEK